MNRTERKEAGLWQPTGVKLGCPWPKLGRTRANLALTCAELRPVGSNLGPTGGPIWRSLGTFGWKLGLTCATWSCARPRTIEAQKIGNSAENAIFQHVALNPPNRAQGAHFEPKLEPIGFCCAEVGPAYIHMGPKLKPCDAHGDPSQQLGTLWWQLCATNGDMRWGRLP